MKEAHPIPGFDFIARASRLVPFMRRGAWRREWEAEVTYAWSRLTRDGPPSRLAVLRLRLRIYACSIDALWEMKETMTMAGLLNDVRQAVRSLMRYPTFAVIAVLTLALGIGANTAVFTLVDGVLISPLPFDDAEELIAVRHQGREGRDALPMSTGLYNVYRENATSIEEIALYAGTTVTLVVEGEPERIRAQVATPSFFPTLGVEAATGRTFTEDEGAPEGAQVALISDGMWKSRFGGDPAVIGKSLDVNGTIREIVGVMPPDFGYPGREALLWIPYVINPEQAPLAAFGAGGVARLSEGNTVQTALTEFQGLIGRLPELFPESGAVSFLQEVGLAALVRPLKKDLVGDLSSTLWVVFGTVGFVLLIACANVANLLLVRAEGRQRELALRVALGAGRAQVLRAFMSESAVLASVGGLLGVVIASTAVRTSLGMIPTSIPRIAEIGVDMRVMGFTAVIALGCAIFFGLFPLVRYGVDDLAGELREGDGRGTGGKKTHRLRNGLVIAQMALALVLLVGSGLMFRSFQALRAVDPGFDTENILVASVVVPTAEIQSWEEASAFYRRLGDVLEGQAGVEAVGFAMSAPLNGGLGYYSIEVEDHPRGEGELPVFAQNQQTEAGYLEAIGIDLLEGRTFRDGDGAEGARAVIVAKSFAEHWWPDASPLGRRMRLGFTGEDWYTIVGVVADAHYDDLATTPEEMVYWPATVGPAEGPQPTRAMDVVIRSAIDPLQYVDVLRREVRALNPRIPISNPRSMETVVDEATSRTSFTMSLLGASSAIALLLGLVGIYGVISYVVSQRTREIGVRMALGATAPSVRGMVVKQGMVLALTGVGVGLVTAGGLSRYMSSLLYGVAATDPVTYGGVAAALVMVALAASWIPATRAASVDPSNALRGE